MARILVVGDPSDRNIVRDALTHDDRSNILVEVADRIEFEHALKDPAIDAVVTEVDVPGFVKWHVLDRFFATRPEVPVIIVAASGNLNVAVEAMKRGAADYIVKNRRSIARLPQAIISASDKACISSREISDRYRRAIVDAPVPIAITAEDGEIITVSRSWETIAGYAPEETPSIQEWVQRALGYAYTELLTVIEKTHQGTGPEYLGEFQIHCSDGTTRIWDFHSTPLGQLPDGRRCAVTVANDITRHHALESQLRHGQKMESLGRLAGGVAHDFNNMLQVITGSVALALLEVPDGVEPPAYLQMISDATVRSADLTRQLLAFSRNQPVEPHVIDLNKELGRITRMLERIVRESVELRLEIAPDTWPIHMDPAQLDSVMANLVINARDAINGEGTITITTKNTTPAPGIIEQTTGDYVLISVRDTGIGMEESTLGRVFEPYFTTKATGSGTGLGLPAIYGIVTQNGGSVDLTSTPGLGTEFRLYLPRCVASGATPLPDTGGVQTASHDGFVLLVEDEPAVLEITERMLKRLGYRVVATGSAKHALELVSEGIGEVALVVTDVIMPEINGHELVERLRAVLPGVPALFTSGYPAEIVGKHGIMPESVHFLSKPYDQKKLGQKIREILIEERH